MLYSRGVLPPRYVGMAGENSPAHLMVYFALILGGWRPVALSLHFNDEHLAHIVQEADLAAVFVSDGASTRHRYERLAAEARAASVAAATAATAAAAATATAASAGVEADTVRNCTGGYTIPVILPCLHLLPDALASWITTELAAAAVNDSGGSEGSASSSSNNSNHSSNSGVSRRDTSSIATGQATSLQDLEDPLLILYTSGSTGMPKGAIMSERSFLCELKGMVRDDDTDTSGVDLVDAPVATSATPYNIAGALMTGGRLVVYPELVRVFDVAAEVAPTSLGLVPQLWAVLYKRFQRDLRDERATAAAVAVTESPTTNDDVISSGSSGISSNNNNHLNAAGPANAAIAAPAPAGKAQAATAVVAAAAQAAAAEARLVVEYRLRHLGWRIGGINCGGATPMPQVQAWLKRVYDSQECNVTENYASTEAGPITSSWGANEGVVADGVEIRLLDWGDYCSTDKPFPRGELLVRSATLSTGFVPPL